MYVDIMHSQSGFGDIFSSPRGMGTSRKKKEGQLSGDLETHGTGQTKGSRQDTI